MNREQVLKLLTSLGAKVSADGADGAIKEDDAVKLVENEFNAANKGLVDNRDALLAEVKTHKDKITAMESASTESNQKIGELEAQIKKNSPADIKAHYDTELAAAKTKFEQELAGITTERDKYKESHLTRVKNDVISEAIKGIEFENDTHKRAFILLAMDNNKFEPIEVTENGVLKTTFLNQDKKTIDAVIHELKLSTDGKAFIKNGNQGSGAQGGQTQNQGTGLGGKTMTESQFDALSAQAQLDFVTKDSGVVTPD